MLRRVGATAWPAAVSLALLTAAPAPTLTPVASVHPGWTVTADSAQGSHPAGDVLDGDAATSWQTTTPRTGGHVLLLDTGAVGPLAGLLLTPRQDGSPDGNIGQFRVEVSANGSYWRNVAAGVLADTRTAKTVQFPLLNARYVRLTALSEAGNRGPWTSLAELDVIRTAPAAPPPGTGRWSSVFNLPLVAAGAANLSNGKVLLWSSYKPDHYANVGQSDDPGQTVTAVFDPATSVISQRTVTETQHDMFCPGTALLADGTLLVNGGSSDTRTSLYDPRSGVWSDGGDLAVPRGYQASVTTSTGAVFTLGGSWNHDPEDKDGELWTRAGGSTLLPGAEVAPILTADPQGPYRADNHAWLFASSAGTVFQAGPSRAMHWYSTSGKGSVTDAGLRGDDADAMNGSAVMYDIDKVLAVGGAPAYSDSVATAHAATIDISGATPVVTTLAPMANARAFATSVVLPDGTVLVVGGQAYAKPYSDATSVLRPELFNPATGTFRQLAPMQVPRNYHSTALLLPDGRVLVAGGGLCGPGCEIDTNHTDAEVFTPPYLLSPTGTPLTRPSISSAPATAAAGATVPVKTAKAVTRFALLRLASVTHSVNNDQRRVPLQVVGTVGTTYSLKLPADHGVLVPGAYLLFALDSRGVPSVARTIVIT